MEVDQQDFSRNGGMEKSFKLEVYCLQGLLGLPHFHTFLSTRGVIGENFSQQLSLGSQFFEDGYHYPFSYEVRPPKDSEVDAHHPGGVCRVS